MNTEKRLIKKCEALGILLEPRGDILWVEPAERVPEELIVQLRRHKLKILSALEKKQRAASLHLLRQVASGEFSGCSTSTAKSISAVLSALSKSNARDFALFKLDMEISKQ
ncbi:MAG: hypothetical protein ABSG87_10400 [Verrucomicrobiota bacterium]|jgi:hypothetical protein